MAIPVPPYSRYKYDPDPPRLVLDTLHITATAYTTRTRSVQNRLARRRSDHYRSIPFCAFQSLRVDWSKMVGGHLVCPTFTAS